MHFLLVRSSYVIFYIALHEKNSTPSSGEYSILRFPLPFPNFIYKTLSHKFPKYKTWLKPLTLVTFIHFKFSTKILQYEL